jgi:hypothetical protein
MRLFLLSLPLLTLGACKDAEAPHGHDENEVITTVVLTFTPTGGGAALEFTWADPEDDGSPVIDDVTLSDAADYDLTIQFINELASPSEDITEEVADESDEHQVFVLGSAVQGPATGDSAGAVITHSYDDTDGNGDPIGLANSVETIMPGSGDLQIVLRHLPPENDSPVKTATLADDVATGGLSAIGGSTDADVTFDLTVE